MRTFCRRSCSRAFTMIEFLVCLGIISIIFCIAIPSFARMNHGAGQHGSSRAIVSMLRLARQMAATRKAIYIVDFEKSSSTVRIIDEDGDQEAKTLFLPEGVFFWNAPADLDDVQYFPEGRAIKVGGGAAINSVWIARQGNPGKADRITVTATTGRVLLRKDQDTP